MEDEGLDLEIIDLATTNQFKLMGLINPVLCIGCDQSKTVIVRKPGEKTKKMFSCLRLDCDNWEMIKPQ